MNYSAFRVKIRDPDGVIGMGDLGQIVLNETIAMADKPARFLAKKIRSAAEKARENGCSCWCINVLAHSQGTMVFELALKFLRGETELLKHIRFTGMGGETTIGVEKHGVGSARNLAHNQDPVPRMGQTIPFNNGNGPPEETYGDPNEFEKPIEAHSWERYLNYLESKPSKQSCINQ